MPDTREQFEMRSAEQPGCSFGWRCAEVCSLVALLCLLITPAASAESNPAEFPSALWQDAQALPTAHNLWWTLGGAALTLAVSSFEDSEGAARALDRDVLDELADTGNIWGDPVVQGSLAVGTWGLGKLADHEETAELGYDLTRALALSWAVTGALKGGITRKRPNGDPHSFPSGHSSTAFAVAGVMTRHYGGWIGGISLGLAALTAMGRMEDRKHHASDVVAGATVGWILGRNAARESGDGGWKMSATGNALMVTRQF